MKLNPVTILLFLIACQASDKIKPATPEACSDQQYIRGKELTGVETIIIAKTYNLSAQSFTVYHLDQPDVAGLTAPWTACNLPKQFQKDKLAVRFNGYTLINTGADSEISFGIPLELTKIEVR